MTGSYVESFTSSLLNAKTSAFDATPFQQIDPEEDDIIKWLAAGLYVGGADTVCLFELLRVLYKPDSEPFMFL